MTDRYTFFAAVAVALLLCACAGRDFNRPSLYQRLGGKGGLTVIVDGWLGRLTADAGLGRHFGEGDADRIRPLMVEQLCAMTGGPCVYRGRDMKAAHAPLKIQGGEYDATLSALDYSMVQYRVPEGERKALRALLEPLRQDVINP